MTERNEKTSPETARLNSFLHWGFCFLKPGEGLPHVTEYLATEDPELQSCSHRKVQSIPDALWDSPQRRLRSRVMPSCWSLGGACGVERHGGRSVTGEERKYFTRLTSGHLLKWTERRDFKETAARQYLEHHCSPWYPLFETCCRFLDW